MRTELIDEFITFASYMNFSKAAVALNLTQPNLSKHMMELERELGFKLIDRESHGKLHPVLTFAGKHFLEESSVWRNRFREIIDECKDIEHETPQVLRMQEMQSTSCMAKLIPLVEQYTHQNRGIVPLFMNLENIHPTDALAHSEFDVVLRVCFGDSQHVTEQMEQNGYECVPFLQETSTLWFQKDNAGIDSKGTLTLEDLANIPIIEIRGKNYDYIAEAYLERCTLEGIRPIIKYKQYLESTITSLFLSNFREGAILSGTSFVNDPRLSSRSDLDHIVLDDPRTLISMFLACSGDNPLAVEFLDFVRENQ